MENQTLNQKYGSISNLINTFGIKKEDLQAQAELERYASRVFKAKEMFAEKPFGEDNRRNLGLAHIASYLTSAFSVMSGLYFLYSTFVLIFYFDVLSWILAGLFLVLLEYAKHTNITPLFVFYFRGKQNLAPLGAFVFVLLALSVFFSTKGVEQFYSQVMHQKPVLENTKALGNGYESRIKEIERQRTEFTNSVSWKGQINIYDAQVRSTLANFDNQITKIRQEKKQALDKAENSNQKLLQSNEQTQVTNVLYLLLIFGLNELICLLALWYPAYYNFQTLRDQNRLEQLSTTSEAPSSPILPKVQNEHSVKELVKENQELKFTQNQTGFRPNFNKVENPNPNEQAKDGEVSIPLGNKTVTVTVEHKPLNPESIYKKVKSVRNQPKIVEMYKNGYTLDAIADHCDLAVNTVRSSLRVAGLLPPAKNKTQAKNQ